MKKLTLLLASLLMLVSLGGCCANSLKKPGRYRSALDNATLHLADLQRQNADITVINEG